MRRLRMLLPQAVALHHHVFPALAYDNAKADRHEAHEGSKFVYRKTQVHQSPAEAKAALQEARLDVRTRLCVPLGQFRDGRHLSN